MESNNHDFNDLGMKNRLDDSHPKSKNAKRGRAVAIATSLIALLLIAWFLRLSSSKKQGAQIEIDNNKIIGSEKKLSGSVKEGYPLENLGDRSPISGIPCENWNRRPIAVMQPSDVSARPLAGISEADMVFEVPVLVSGKPRLMGVYVCGSPQEIGSLRSSRHDFLHLAKGLDSIYVHWGGAQFAKEKLNEKLIDNLNCNNDGGQSAGSCCFRKEGLKLVDSGYMKFDEIINCSNDFDYRLESKFSGYLHQGEAPIEDRIEKGVLKVGMDTSTGPYYVEYEYDKESNSYLRTWGGVADIDRNNNKRVAPKNVVILTASQEIMTDDNNTIYNNVQLGDPWYDNVDKGEAFYYINGREIIGSWEKDSSRMDSRLIFRDGDGDEIRFVPGQIWVNVLEPGRALKWEAEIN